MIEENQHINPDWQDIFNDASISPPEGIWAGIEHALDEENTWKTPFENAEIAPTPALWAKIEAELEPEKRRGIVLWLKSNSLRIAATILFSIFSYQLSIKNEEKEAQRNNGVMNYELSVINKINGKKSNEQLSINNQQLTISNKYTELQSRKVKIWKEREIVIKNLPTSPSEQSDESAGDLIELRKDLSFTPHYTELASHVSSLINHHDSFPNFLNFSQYKEQKTKSNKKEYWFAMASGAAPFNPNLDFGGVQSVASAAFMNEDIFNDPFPFSAGATGSAGNVTSTKATLPTINQPINESKSGVSLQFGLMSGMSLTKRISIETGLQVIKGNSSIVSNTFLIDRETSEMKNIYELATSNQTNNEVKEKNVGIVSEEQISQNNYLFLQVPVRVGYQLWQKNRISLSVLGGTSLDIFSMNRLGTTTLNSSNSPYKKLNMSALAGIRVNYKLYKNWYWGTGLNYQQALFPNNKPDALLGMKMKLVGINMGLQYKF